MVATRCIKCTKPLTTGGQYCDDCRPTKESSPISSDAPAAASCPECDSPLHSEAKFCSSCGHELGIPVRYAGFWIRLAASMIDGIILSALIGILMVALSSVQGLGYLLIMVPLFYSAGFEATQGATPGKMALGMKLRMVNGDPVTLRAGIVRYFGYWLSTLTLGIGFFMVGLTKKKRGLHDMIAGTVVVMERKKRSVEPISHRTVQPNIG